MKLKSTRLLASLTIATVLIYLTFSLFFHQNVLNASPNSSPNMGIIYVDKNALVGLNDGSSWDDAYLSLITALENSTSGDEIWVARGVYTPGVMAESTFNMVENVGIYGGFIATETTREQRNWETNLTILSGDLESNDAVNEYGIVTDTAQITGTNSYHVVTANSLSTLAILDGFHITAGNASGNGFEGNNHQGGGIFLRGASPLLANLKIVGNVAAQGGGQYGVGISFFLGQTFSSPHLQNVVFESNSATDRGGGLYIGGTSSVTIEDSKFLSNTASGSGGGIYLTSLSDPLIMTDVLMAQNSAEGIDTSDGGGGLYTESSIQLSNVSIIGNSASRGGGWYNKYSFDSTLTNMIFSGNEATGDSGQFSFDVGGGAIWNETGAPKIVNATITGNKADGDSGLGGGIYSSRTDNLIELINSIVWNNSDSSGGQTVTSSIYVKNSTGAASQKINNSIVAGSGGSSGWNNALGVDLGNNLDEDPRFTMPISPSLAPTINGHLTVQSLSPAIDAGSTLSYTSPITKDVAGNSRIQNDSIDMGALESSLEASFVILTAVSGDGLGAISRSPVAITQTKGTTITFSAEAAAGSAFDSWEGLCEAATTPICLVSVTGNAIVTATFSDLPGPGFTLSPLNEPDLGSTITDTVVTFNWDGAITNQGEAPIKEYTLQLTVTLPVTPTQFDMISAADIITYEFVTSETSYTPTVNLPAGEYQWTVSAEDVDGNITSATVIYGFTREVTEDDSITYIYLPLIARD